MRPARPASTMNVSSPWRAYLQTLYGGQHAYVRPSNVSIIYSTVVPLNLSLDDMFGPLSNDCSGLRHEHQFNQWDVPSTQFVRHRSHASLSPLRSHSWVEVTHCAERVRRRKECSRPSHCLEQTVFTRRKSCVATLSLPRCWNWRQLKCLRGTF